MEAAKYTFQSCVDYATCGAFLVLIIVVPVVTVIVQSSRYVTESCMLESFNNITQLE